MLEEGPDPLNLETELDQLLEECLALPESEWPDALARAARTHTHLAERLGERLQALGQFGLLESRRTIGAYTLLRPLGSGATGQVFLAQEEGSEELVAIKVLHPSLRMSDTARRRFEREFKLASCIEDPRICRIHHSGSTDGVPYIVMDYVEGENLLSFAANLGNDARQLLPVLTGVAEALAVAHDAGLAHRDVKPGNILVRPNGDPVLLDFGLARMVANPTHSLTGSEGLLGSPAYLAPEAIHHNAALGMSSDIYALGVTMYECLTGTLPFHGVTPAALFYSVLNETAPDASAIKTDLPGGLSTVVRIAMAKTPVQRYSSARALVADLSAVQSGRPIAARLPSRFARARYWVRRNPRVSIAVVLLVASLITAIVSSRHERALALAFESKDLDPIEAVELARAAVGLYDHSSTRSALHEAVARCRRHKVYEFKDQQLDPVSESRSGLSPTSCAFLPGGRGLIGMSRENFLWCGTLEGRQLLWEGGVLHFAADEKGVVLSYGEAGDWTDQESRIDRFDYSGKLVSSLRGSSLALQTVQGSVTTIYIDADGVPNITSSDGAALALPRPATGGMWNAAHISSEAQRLFLVSTSQTLCTDWEGNRIAILDGRVIMSAADGDSCIIEKDGIQRWIHVASGREYARIPNGDGALLLDISRDGQLIAYTRGLREVEVVGISGRIVGRIADHGMFLDDIEFAPHTRNILTGDGDGVARLYDETGRFLSEIRGHAGFVTCVAFDPESERIMTGSDDHRLRVFDLLPGIDHIRRGHRSNIRRVDVSAKGRTLSCDDSGELRLWEKGEASSQSRSDVASACFVGESIVLSTHSGELLLPEADLKTIASKLARGAGDGVVVDMISHGRQLATLENDQNAPSCTIRLWKYEDEWLPTPVEIHPPEMVRSLDFNPKASRLVCAGITGRVYVYDLEGAALGEFSPHSYLIWTVRLSPGGTEILTCSRDNTAVLSTLDGKRILTLSDHRGTVSKAIFSHDGEFIATSSVDKAVRVWTRRGEPVAELRGHRGQVWGLAFSHDGLQLTSGAYDRELRTWPLSKRELLRHADQVLGSW